MGRSATTKRNLCPTLRPTKEVFESKDFVQYVREVFKKNPELGMFKVCEYLEADDGCRDARRPCQLIAPV